jgi:hypothetical protein
MLQCCKVQKNMVDDRPAIWLMPTRSIPKGTAVSVRSMMSFLRALIGWNLLAFNNQGRRLDVHETCPLYNTGIVCGASGFFVDGFVRAIGLFLCLCPLIWDVGILGKSALFDGLTIHAPNSSLVVLISFKTSLLQHSVKPNPLYIKLFAFSLEKNNTICYIVHSLC